MALSQEKQEQFIQDYNAGMKTSALTKKYKISNDQYTYHIIWQLRKQNLLHPKSSKKVEVSKNHQANSRKKAWETRRANLANGEKKVETITNKPVADYRTVYFKDFSVQIHKKAMARLVVDHNNNLHILNN